MKSIQEIKSELREIRYYYTRTEVFNGLKDLGIQSNATRLVEKYNEMIGRACAEECDTYVSLYIKNYTQEMLARERGYSVAYIKYLSKKLYLFFQKEWQDSN